MSLHIPTLCPRTSISTSKIFPDDPMSCIRIYKAGRGEAGAGEMVQGRRLAGDRLLVLRCRTVLG